jgi:hypothetical protein
MTQSAEEIVALARSVRLKGFEKPVLAQKPSRSDSAVVRAQWAADATAAEKTPPISSPAAEPQPRLMAIDQHRWLSASLQKTAATEAAATSTQQFLRVEIAAGGQADLASLECRMGGPIAGNYRGQATWLQRNHADGSQTRAIAGMASDLARLRSGLAGSTEGRVSFSVGTIDVKTFSGQGAKVPSGLPPAMLPSTCDALLRAVR